MLGIKIFLCAEVASPLVVRVTDHICMCIWSVDLCCTINLLDVENGERNAMGHHIIHIISPMGTRRVLLLPCYSESEFPQSSCNGLCSYTN